jgi:hypothetical protein
MSGEHMDQLDTDNVAATVPPSGGSTGGSRAASSNSLNGLDVNGGGTSSRTTSGDGVSNARAHKTTNMASFYYKKSKSEVDLLAGESGEEEKN